MPEMLLGFSSMFFCSVFFLFHFMKVEKLGEMSGINSNALNTLAKSLPLAFFPLPLDPSNLPWIVPSIPIALNQSLNSRCSNYLSSNAVCEAGSTQITTFSDLPTIPGHHIIYFHLNFGVSVNFTVGDKIQTVNGPLTVPLITTTSDPPVPLPIEVPKGHVVQQIVDETGILRHVIISPLPPSIPIPACYYPDDVGEIGMKNETLDVETTVESDSCDRENRNSDLDMGTRVFKKKRKTSSKSVKIIKHLSPDVIEKSPAPVTSKSVFKLKLAKVTQVLKQKTDFISFEHRVGIIAVIFMIVLAIFISIVTHQFVIVK